MYTLLGGLKKRCINCRAGPPKSLYNFWSAHPKVFVLLGLLFILPTHPAPHNPTPHHPHTQPLQVITPGCSSSDSSADPQLSKAQKSPVGERAGPLSVGPP